VFELGRTHLLRSHEHTVRAARPCLGL
jgi:hypothetical protein